MSVPAAVASAVFAAFAAALTLPAGPPRLTFGRARRGGLRDRSPDAGRVRMLGSVLSALLGWYVVGGWFGLAVAPVAGVTAYRFLDGLEPRPDRQRRERLARSLPLTVDLLASSLAVGASPATAVALVAEAVDPPMRDELAGISARLAFGVDPVRVWLDVGHDPQLGPLGRCLARALETGASVSEAMLRLAEDLRADARADTEQVARSVGVKAALPLGLCLLPAFVLIGVVPLVAGSLAPLTGR